MPWADFSANRSGDGCRIRSDAKPILISTVTGNCLCYLALAFAPNIFVAFLVRLLGGMASGNGAVIQGYIADVTPPEERTGKMSWLGAAYNIGFIVGPALGGLLAHPSAGHAGFRIPLLVASGLSAICVIGLIFVSQGEPQSIVRISARPSRWAVVRTAVLHPVVSRLMLVTFLAGCAFNGIESVFGLWTQARFDWGPQQVGVAFAVTGIVAADLPNRVTGPRSQAIRRGTRSDSRHGADYDVRDRCSLFRSDAG